MIKKILCAMLGLLFTISANAACNLYNKANGALTGYPSEGMKWTTGGGEKSILIKLTEGETYTIRRVDGSGAVLRIVASSTDTLTAGQSLQRIYIGSKDDTVKTFSVPDGYPYVLIYVYNTNGSTITSTQAIDGFMIVKGSEIPDEYIPYDAACIERCKNLFDKAQTPYNSGMYISSATVGQTGFELSSNSNYNVYRVEIQPSTTYTFGLIKATSPKWVVTDANNVVLDTGTNNGGEAGNSITITTGATAKYLYLSVSVNEKYKCIDILQLEQGDVATEYVPYNAACHNNKITIATTKYNETAFSPLNTALANAISVVDSVVSNTINQAASIATLQTQKQTRPNDIADDNEKCPAGKKCLLVEDASGIPHWYEIVERYSRLPDGYTELEYLTSGTDGQYIDTGILFDPTKNFRVVGNFINPYATLRKVILGNYYSQQSETYYSIELYTDGKFRNYMSADGGSAFNIYSPTAVPADTMAYFDTSYNALAHQTTTTLRYGTTEQTYSGATPETTTVAVHTLKLFNDKRNLSPVYNNPVSIGAVQIYIDDILAHHYVPARRESDNVLGMYDLADQNPATAFYTNAGEGSFIAGAPVSE